MAQVLALAPFVDVLFSLQMMVTIENEFDVYPDEEDIVKM